MRFLRLQDISWTRWNRENIVEYSPHTSQWDRLHWPFCGCQTTCSGRFSSWQGKTTGTTKHNNSVTAQTPKIITACCNSRVKPVCRNSCGIFSLALRTFWRKRPCLPEPSLHAGRLQYQRPIGDWIRDNKVPNYNEKSRYFISSSSSAIM